MSTEYTIAAIPTLYRGRMYRSRLEARWGAFFDRLGWQYEYEPFDLGKWSPDFAITSPFNALIEIKPLTEPDPELFKRVQDAARGEAVFVMRLAPFGNDGPLEVGWWAATHAPAWLLWFPDPERPVFYADLISISRDRKLWVTATQGTGPINEPPTSWGYPAPTMALWADACNAVQWEPKP